MILLEEEDINNLTEYWDQFTAIHPAKFNQSTFNKILSVYSKIIDRNQPKPHWNESGRRSVTPDPFLLPGYKIQINDSEKDMMLNAIGLSYFPKKDLPYALDLVKNCQFFMTISKKEGMKAKLAFFLPMVCYAALLYSWRKENECALIFNILAMVAYTGAVSESFYSINLGGNRKAFHGTLIDQDIMITVIEDKLNNKSDAKNNTVRAILNQKMRVSLNNYAVKNRYLTDFPITDKRLNEIVTAGIISRISAFVHEIAEQYYALKNNVRAGKDNARGYASGSFVGRGETGEDEIVAVDYRSNSAIIETIVNNALSELVRPDLSLIDKAVNTDFGLKYSNKDEAIYERKTLVKMNKEVLGIINHILDEYSQELPTLLRAILYAYLFDKKKENNKVAPGFKYGDYGFIIRCMKAFNNNRLDKNVNIIKRKMNLFLTGSEDPDEGTPDGEAADHWMNGSAYYHSKGKSTRGNIRNYVYMYFVLVLWESYKVSL